MANVFKQVTEPNNKVNTSSFDLSFQNNLTMQFGYLYPCFVKKVAPKTKLTIKPTFGLNFMPMMFPVQTRMRARMSFYKVRCRSLWKDYKDWFGNLKPNLAKPYINFDTEEKLKKMASTGSLGDYLGLPTTLSKSAYGSPNRIPLPSSNSTIYYNYLYEGNPVLSTDPDFSVEKYRESLSRGFCSFGVLGLVSSNMPTKAVLNFFSLGVRKVEDSRLVVDYSFKPLAVHDGTDYSAQDILKGCVPFFTTLAFLKSGANPTAGIPTFIATESEDAVTYDPASSLVRVHFTYDIPEEYSSYEVLLSFPTWVSHGVVEGEGYGIYSYNSDASRYLTAIYDADTFPSSVKSSPYIAYPFGSVFDGAYFDWRSAYVSADSGSSISDITLDTSPYYNSSSPKKDKQLMLDASFFRAYEAIYNAYFRDIRNNPYILNGQAEYNIFIPTDEGGEDNNVYELRRRNWEADFLSTAVPSPQQGRAPLVGITNYNDTTSLAFTAEDGKRYAVNFDYDSDAGEMKNLSFQELPEGAPIKEARNMMDLVSSGISISDLRNVNAYTKFLELNMRKGYFYKDLVEGHFDTKVRYDELNMPEFIGGTAKDVFVNPISQTVQTTQDGSYFGSLGSYAGQASVQGTAENTISVYCDEECIIMGLISVTPVANYSQLLPKQFLHRELLDSYFPEFDNIGFQPIFYNEVCPIQAYNDNPDSLSELFGYQRPWYDYVASTDEVHGLFRTNLRNFLINRVFDSKPTLSPDFLLVDPEQVNDVFSVTQTTDKILGQIYFDVTAVAPISRIAIPRLD